MHTPRNSTSLAPIRTLIALAAGSALALAGCSSATPAPAGSAVGGGTPAPGAVATTVGDMGVAGTAGTPLTGELATAAAVVAGQTAAPGESATPPTGTPLPTAEAAAEATAQQATAMAAVLPRYVATIGSPGTEPGQIMLPFDVALAPDGSLFISDSTGVQQFGADGRFIRRIGEGDLPMAEGIAVGADGRLFVTGYGGLVQIFDAAGEPAGTLGTAGDQPGQLRKPTDVAIDAAGNLYIADAGNARIEKFAPDGRHLQTIGERGSQSGQFMAPRSVAVDDEGRIYVGMGDDYLVQRFTPDGEYLDTFGQGTLDETISRTGGIAIGPDGKAYVTQAMGHSVQSFDLAGSRPTLIGQLGGRPGVTSEQFNSPTGIAISGDRLYVADTRNSRILVFQLQ
jgi:DNA-binding beta-propeller fold protein YncE